MIILTEATDAISVLNKMSKTYKKKNVKIANEFWTKIAPELKKALGSKKIQVTDGEGNDVGYFAFLKDGSFHFEGKGGLSMNTDTWKVDQKPDKFTAALLFQPWADFNPDWDDPREKMTFKIK